MEVKEYFIERAPKSGKGLAVWNRVSGCIVQCGVETMAEFGEKDFGWLLSVFGEDREGIALAEQIMEKYCADAYKDKLNALVSEGKTPVEVYFRAHGPQAAPDSLISRAIRTLRFLDIETMEQLCAVPLTEYRKVRSVGEKTVELVLLMRKKYTTPK